MSKALFTEVVCNPSTTAAIVTSKTMFSSINSVDSSDLWASGIRDLTKNPSAALAQSRANTTRAFKSCDIIAAPARPTNFGRGAHVHREMRLNMIDKFWYSGHERIGLIYPLLAFRAIWRYHPIRADRLARALAALSGAPEGWVWRVGIQKSGPLVSFRVPPTPFRKPAYTKGPGHCCVCGQPIFRFGLHRDLWGDRRPNQNATWHSCCVAAWNLWIAPSDHVRHLKVLQKRRCLATSDRLLKNAEVDHHVPLFKVWHDYRDRPWPALLAFWGVPNLQVINRSAHVEKCAQEAGERRVRVIPAIADRSPQTVYRPEGSSPVLSVSLSCAAQA